MDIVAACTAFVSVSDRGSFTVGAAAAGMQQSVASRRIAALERHLGEPLFDRSTRRPQLTSFGHGMLAAARSVTSAAAELEAQARRSRSAVLRVAVPTDASARGLGAFLAATRSAEVNVSTFGADPATRAEAFSSGVVQIAVVTVPAERARWSIPLGVAMATPEESPFLLGSLRPSRSTRGAMRRLLYEAEEDIPSIRDTLLSFRDANALAPAQLAAAGAVTEAVADVLAGDLLLSTRMRADELGFFWSPLADVTLVRSYALVTSGPEASGWMEHDVLALLGQALGEEQ